MADIVWSLFYRLPNVSDEAFEPMVEMARLWAAHLRGPGEHRGPVMLIGNVTDIQIEGATFVPFDCQAVESRQLLAETPVAAYQKLRPTPRDRLMQMDIDALTRHPIAPMFDAIRAGQMRVSPSSLPLTHWQQAGRFLGRSRRWYGWVRGWRWRLGVSSSLTACLGQDWERFVGRWAALAERYRDVPLDHPRPGDQGYLNHLYAFERLPMCRYGPEDIHHLREPETTPRDQVDQARVLHFPLHGKLSRMREWSRV